MEKTIRIVRDQFGQAFQRAKQVYDGRVKKLQFQVDNLVWFFCPRKRPRLGPKWQLLTSGSWRIEKVLNSVNYVIRREGGRDRRVVHVDRLRRFNEAAETGAVPTDQPTGHRQIGSDGAGISANALPMTSDVVGTPVVAVRPQRLRAIPA